MHHTPAPALDISRLIRISAHPYYTHLMDEEAEAQRVKSAFSIITRLSGRYRVQTQSGSTDCSNESLWKHPAGQVPEAPSLSFPPHLRNGAAGSQVSPEGLWSIPVT